MKRYEALMTMDDTVAYSLIDRDGAEMWKTIETLKTMMSDAEPEDYETASEEDWTRFNALGKAVALMYKEYESAAKSYCEEARKSEGFREYAEAHKNLWLS
jgi:hypothetical protein